VKVTIVGAGVAGCAIAWELASRGAAVQVVDPRGVGKGATYASAGILAPRIEGRMPELLRLTLCSLGLFDTFIARLRRDSATSIEYERSGTLQVALDERDVIALKGAAGHLSDAHIPHSWLEARHARRVEPSLSADVIGALLIPEHGYVGVTALVEALAVAARARGVEFLGGRVDEIRGGEPARTVTSDGLIESDVVVIAAGSWSSQLAPAGSGDAASGTGGAPHSVRPSPVHPIRGQLLDLRMPARAASRVLWGTHCYIVPWHDGTVLVGATVEDVGFDESATVAGVQQLSAAAVRMLPVLEQAAFSGVRVGLRPATSDELPVIGSSSTMPGIVYATGHFRNGVLLAPLTALLVADLVLENRARTELALTRPDRLGL
jgi:glycine oxidase